MIIPYFWKTSKTNYNDVIIGGAPAVTYREVMLHNVVDKPLQSALQPLNLMQRLFICAKYSIRDNFIVSNTNTYNYVGLSCALIFRFILLYSLITSINQMIGITSLLSLCDIDDFIFFSIGFIINYYSNIVQCNNNVFLILKVQHVIRNLKIDIKVMKAFVVSNWCYIIALNCVFISSNAYYCMFHVVGNGWDHLSSYTSITFDVNIVYASFILSLLRRLVTAWIKEIESNGACNTDCYWNAMFDLYVNILEAYKFLRITFRLQVSKCLCIIIYSRRRHGSYIGHVYDIRQSCHSFVQDVSQDMMQSIAVT